MTQDELDRDEIIKELEEILNEAIIELEKLLEKEINENLNSRRSEME